MTLRPPVVLPARLDELLLLLRDPNLYPVPSLGYSSECRDDNHPVQPWIDAHYGERDLRLLKCAACAAVEVRDVSFDLNIGGSSLSRRRIYALLGRYSAPRPRGREFLGSLGTRRA